MPGRAQSPEMLSNLVPVDSEVPRDRNHHRHRTFVVKNRHRVAVRDSSQLPAEMRLQLRNTNGLHMTII